jgi:hypothetical protein
VPGAGEAGTRLCADYLLTAAEARGLLRISRSTEDTLARAGLLEKVYVFTGVRYRASQVDKLVRNGTGRRLPGTAA